MAPISNNLISLEDLKLKILGLRFGYLLTVNEISSLLKLNLKSVNKLLEQSIRKEIVKQENN